MDFLIDTNLAIPANQMFMLLILSTGALLFRRIRLALLINFIFTLYWGFVFNRTSFLGSELLEINPRYAYIYLGSGIAFLVLVIIGFLFSGD